MFNIMESMVVNKERLGMFPVGFFIYRDDAQKAFDEFFLPLGKDGFIKEME